MELLYYWIDEDHTYKNTGFHLSNRFTIDLQVLKDKYLLSVKENKDYIPNFFGSHITNVTAIIGENGTGKTNLLYGLISKLTMYNHVFGYKYIIAFYESNTIFISESLSTYDSDRKLHIDCKLEFQVSQPESTKDRDGYPNMDGLLPKFSEIIYYNPIYDFRDYPFNIENRKFADVSSTYLLWKDKENKNTGSYDMVAIHRFQEILRQFQMTQSPFLKDVQEIDEVNLPTEIQIEILKTGSVEKSDLGYMSRDIFEVLRYYGSMILGKHNVGRRGTDSNDAEKMVKLKAKAKTWLLINFFDHFFYCYALTKDLNDHYLNLTWEDFDFFKVHKGQLPETKRDWPKMEIDEYHSIIRKFFAKQNLITKSQYDINENLDRLFQLIDESAKVRHDNEAYFYFPFKEGFEFLGICDRYAKSFNNEFVESFTRVTWRNMSSGELGFINLFARIFHGYYQLVNENTEPDKYPKLIYLLIDEGDHGFHPHWQKALVNTLIKYLKFFEGVKFQILLTSHSPIILSDIPKSNIIFLQKEEGRTRVIDSAAKSETFGSNIHTLFRDTFFIKDGVIGNFAEGKIQNLIDRVEKVTNHTANGDVEELLKEISLVGEPILSNTLKNDILKKSSDQFAISFHEKEIERLRAKQSRENDKT